MKNLLIMTLFFLSFIVNLFGNERIEIKKGEPVTINGEFSSGEWNDASLLNLPVLQDNDTINVFYKHDGNNLLFAFCKNLKKSNFEIRFPEILFDINLTKTTTWDAEDHWFHVSATDCNSKGVWNDYSNCLLVQPDWLAERNFMDAKFNDTVEISIPFVKLGIKLGENNIFGIAFDVTDTQTFWSMFPESCSKDNPSTWAECEIIEDGNSVTEDKIQKSFIFPNPSSEYIEICRNDISSATQEIFIYNSFCECVKKVDAALSNSVQRIDVSQFPAGVYYLQIGNIFKNFTVVR